MDNPAERTQLKNWIPAGAGFLAAALLIAWLNPVPPLARTLGAVLIIYAMAVIDALLILAATASAAFLAWYIIRLVGSKPYPPRVTWRISSRAVWLLPLYLFASSRSLWAVVVATLFVLGLVHVLRNLQPASPQKAALSSGWKVFTCVLAGAAIEAGLVAAGIERQREAIPIVAFATLIVAWHATRGGRSGHPSRGLVTLFLAIVFSSGALVRRVGVGQETGFLGFADPAIAASLYMLQKSFGGPPDLPLVAKRTEEDRREGNANVMIQGLAHRGIFLWPDVKKEATLVPPLPALRRNAFGKDRKTQLTIPFYGAYWFFRLPYMQPPVGSLVTHGSPAVHSFESNDGTPLFEEAHQDLQTNLDLSGCSRIEMDVQNADHKPDLVEIELLMVDRTRWKDTQSLGRKRLTTVPKQTALEETLEYPIPSGSRAKNIVELIVRFHLMRPRPQESAQVEIERFRLVPKARH